MSGTEVAAYCAANTGVTYTISYFAAKGEKAPLITLCACAEIAITMLTEKMQGCTERYCSCIPPGEHTAIRILIKGEQK